MKALVALAFIFSLISNSVFSVEPHRVQCGKDPLALKKYLASSAKEKNAELLVFGNCKGSILLNGFSNLTLRGGGDSATIVGESSDTSVVVIDIRSANVVLENLTFSHAQAQTAVRASLNSNVFLNQVASHIDKPSDAFSPSYSANSNSNIIVTGMDGGMFRASTSSHIDFQAGNKNIQVLVTDNSVVDAASSHFTAVQTWGNGYFYSGEKSAIDKLQIYSKGTVEVSNTEVKHLEMTGSNLFGAYYGSKVSGPFFLTGKGIIFEIDGSILENWQGIDNPNAQIGGHDASINGIEFKGWSWTGEVPK